MKMHSKPQSFIVLVCIIILSSCVNSKKASGFKIIYVDTVLVKCEQFTSEIGFWFTGQKEVICLIPADKYYDKSVLIKKLNSGVIASIKRKLSTDGIDSGLSTSYIVDIIENNNVLGKNVYIESYYFNDLFERKRSN